MFKITLFCLSTILMVACFSEQSAQNISNIQLIMNQDTGLKNLSEEEWKKRLTTEEYRVLREKGTERPFTGKFNDHWDSGYYVCKACNSPLFNGTTKFDAGCGWPSFFDVIDSSKVILKPDLSHGMRRIEVMCSNCNGHLGHVFDDGPNPTGLRYCINSISIDFSDSIENPKK